MDSIRAKPPASSCAPAASRRSKPAAIWPATRAGAARAQHLFPAHRRTMISGLKKARCISRHRGIAMRNVLWIGVAVASALTMADARAAGEGLAASADRVPWARFQSRVAYSPGASGWRAEFAPSERSGVQVGAIGVLGDLYFGELSR